MSHISWIFSFWGIVIVFGSVEFFLDDPKGRSGRPARWPANIGLSIVNGAIAAAIPVSTIAAASWASAKGYGLMALIEEPYWIGFCVAILLRSLCQYVFHRAFHGIPIFWSIHRVHHSDVDVDCTTGLRFHPAEYLLSVAFYVPIVVILGLDPIALLAYETVEIIVGIATHTSIKLPTNIDRVLQMVFITPCLHRMHHSDFHRETDTNYGTVFSFWDRLFGTFCATIQRPLSEFSFGVDGMNRCQTTDFTWLLLLPLRNLLPKCGCLDGSAKQDEEVESTNPLQK